MKPQVMAPSKTKSQTKFAQLTNIFSECLALAISIYEVSLTEEKQPALSSL